MNTTVRTPSIAFQPQLTIQTFFTQSIDVFLVALLAPPASCMPPSLIAAQQRCVVALSSKEPIDQRIGQMTALCLVMLRRL